MVTEVKPVGASGCVGWGRCCEGAWGSSVNDGNVPFLDGGVCYVKLETLYLRMSLNVDYSLKIKNLTSK